jgi:hypothetical protein
MTKIDNSVMLSWEKESFTFTPDPYVIMYTCVT